MMGLMIHPEKCPCCRDMLWHCEKCWNMFHHGLRDKDYIPPKYYGQPMFPEDTMARAGFELKIRPDKSRRYREGVYEH